MIIDFHQLAVHDEKIMEEYIKAMDSVGIDKGCIMGMILPEKVKEGLKKMYELWGATTTIPSSFIENLWLNKPADNEFVSKIVKKYPNRFIGFAWVDPTKGKKAVEEIEYAIKDLGLSALKISLPQFKMYPDDERMYPIYEKAVELDVPILFHGGIVGPSPYSWAKVTRPIYFDSIARDFPRLKIIVAHMGWPWFDEMFGVARMNDNIYIEVSGRVLHKINAIRKALFYEITPDKLIYGSDTSPEVLPSHFTTWKWLLNELGLSKQDIEKILGGNAAKLLKIKV